MEKVSRSRLESASEIAGPSQRGGQTERGGGAKPRKDGPLGNHFGDPPKTVFEGVARGKFWEFVRGFIREMAWGETYRGEGGRKLFSVGGLLVRFSPPPPPVLPPPPLLRSLEWTFLKFRRITIQEAQPSARLSEEICLSEGSVEGLSGGSAGSLRERLETFKKKGPMCTTGDEIITDYILNTIRSYKRQDFIQDGPGTEPEPLEPFFQEPPQESFKVICRR